MNLTRGFVMRSWTLETLENLDARVQEHALPWGLGTCREKSLTEWQNQMSAL